MDPTPPIRPTAKRRPPQMDPGKLQVMRERFGLPMDWFPPAGENLHALGEVLPEVLSDMGIEGGLEIQVLQDDWGNLVGGANAKHSRPAAWDDGVLTIYVGHSVWLTEMERFGKRAILKRLQTKLGAEAVQDLRFQLDPGTDM